MACRRRGTCASVAAFILCQFALAVIASDLPKSDTETTSQSTDSGESTDAEADRQSSVSAGNVSSVIQTESSGAPQHHSSSFPGGQEGIVPRPQVTLGSPSVYHGETEGIIRMDPGGDTRPTAHVSSFDGTQHGGTSAGSAARDALPPPGLEWEEISLANIEDGNADVRRRPRPRLFGSWRRLRRSGVRSRRDGRISTTAKLFVLFVFFLFTFLNGAFFGGFPPLASMMARDGAFADLCPLNSTPSNNTGSLTRTPLHDGLTDNGTRYGPGREYQCEPQETAIRQLYPPSLAIACVTSFVAGSLVDCAGPRTTHVLGSIMQITGLLSLGLGYHALGMMMMTSGQQTIYLSSLSLAQDFPSRRSTILGLIGAFASLSQMIPLIMLMAMTRLGLSLWDIMRWYVVAIAVPGLVAGPVLLPSSRTTDESTSDGLTPERTMQDEGTAQNSAGRRMLRRLAALLRTVLHSIQAFVRDRQLRAVILSREFATAVIVFAISGIASSFFIMGADRIIAGDAANYQGIAFPLAAIPCAILGQVADRFGASTALMVLGLAGLIMSTGSFLPGSAAGYLVLIALTMYISAIGSQVMWYTSEAVPSRYAGTFAGLVLTVGGLLSSLANPLYSSVSLGMLGGDTAPVRVGLVILQLFELLVVFLAHRSLRRRQRQHGRGEVRRGRMRRQETQDIPPHPRLRELPDN